MAVIFLTTDPKRLLTDVKTAIDTGKVVTWSYDKDGDFTHTPPQWKNQAWLRPSIDPGRLTLTFLGNAKLVTSKEAYAIYHGRFIEMMLAHFDKQFSSGSASALPSAMDSITTRVA